MPPRIQGSGPRSDGHRLGDGELHGVHHLSTYSLSHSGTLAVHAVSAK